MDIQFRMFRELCPVSAVGITEIDTEGAILNFKPKNLDIVQIDQYGTPCLFVTGDTYPLKTQLEHEFGFEYNTDVQGDSGYLLRGTHDAEGVKALCERWGFGYEEYEAGDEE